jgi:hypothetical protein
MRGFPIFLAALAVIGLGYWAYSQTILTQAAIRDVERLQRRSAPSASACRSCAPNGPISTAPTGLRELVDFNFERLQLLPMVPEQFGTVAELPPAPGARPDGSGRGALFENASTGGGQEP